MGSLRPSRCNAKIRPGSFSHCLVVGRPKSCKNRLASASLEFNAPHFLCGHPAEGLRSQRFYGNWQQLAETSSTNVCYWHKADVAIALSDVCFWGYIARTHSNGCF